MDTIGSKVSIYKNLLNIGYRFLIMLFHESISLIVL